MGVLSMRVAFCVSLAVVSVGCVPTFDDNLPLIDKSTVLAIQAEPAEAAPGKPVQLTSLVGSPELDGSAPKLSWGLCIARKPLTELGPVNPVCIEAPRAGSKDIVDL